VSASTRLVWFRRAARLGAVLAMVVVVVGAWVRLTDAGLGCPDWPGCYGHLHPALVAAHADEASAAFPARPFEYQKAMHEMVHRYIASTLGLVIVGLAAFALWNRRDRAQPRVLPFVLLGVVCLQGALGAFTVTLLLKPLIVTLHLAGGLTTLGLLWWLSLAVDARTPRAAERPARRLAILAVAVVAMQILLGGWTSSNYAAVACPDFPTCQGRWLPDADARDAFVLWRGPGVDFEHGILDQPARTAIHLVHRAGAVVTALVLLLLAVSAFATGRARRVRLAASLLGGAIALQWLIGMNLVWQGFPLWLGTLHNLGAVLVLLATLTLLRALHPAGGGIAMDVMPSRRL
jgi:cytochrome c oxidase assembly protein subunit 15